MGGRGWEGDRISRKDWRRRGDRRRRKREGTAERMIKACTFYE